MQQFARRELMHCWRCIARGNALDTELLGEPAGVRPGCIDGILQSGSSLLTDTTIGRRAADCLHPESTGRSQHRWLPHSCRNAMRSQSAIQRTPADAGGAGRGRCIQAEASHSDIADVQRASVGLSLPCLASVAVSTFILCAALSQPLSLSGNELHLVKHGPRGVLAPTSGQHSTGWAAATPCRSKGPA